MMWDAVIGAGLGAGAIAVGTFVLRGNIGHMVNSSVGRLAIVAGAAIGIWFKAGQFFG